MGLVYRRRVRIGPGLFANLSSRGVSLSKRIGRRLTVGTRGGSVRLAPGLSWRWRWPRR
jgi:hypothetical protein